MKPETSKAIADMADLADLSVQVRRLSSPNIHIGRPEDSITAREHSVLSGIAVSTATRELEGLVAKGKCEVITAIAPATYGEGKITKQRFYRKIHQESKPEYSRKKVKE